MNRPYPNPPHLVAGFITQELSGDVALRRLQDVVGSAGPFKEGPVLVEKIAGGVELAVSGELLGMPAWVALSDEQRAAASRTQQFVRRIFESACAELDPLYAGVELEWRIPAPQELTTELARLPGDLFWSSRLDRLDPDLRADLERIFGLPSRPLCRGRLLVAGGVIEDDPGVEHPTLAAGRRASARLAQAVALTGASE